MDADPTGSWTLPDEYVMLRDSVRRFMEREVRPAEEALPHDATNLPPDVLARLQAQARAMGLWCPQSPAQYGGAGLNLLGQCVVAEEAVDRVAAGNQVPSETDGEGGGGECHGGDYGGHKTATVPTTEASTE